MLKYLNDDTISPRKESVCGPRVQASPSASSIWIRGCVAYPTLVACGGTCCNLFHHRGIIISILSNNDTRQQVLSQTSSTSG